MIKAFDIAILGHFTRDRLVFRDDRRSSSGGGVYYGAVAVARLGYKVAVITKLAKKDFKFLDELRAEGITVFANEAAETSGMENIYTTPDRDERTLRPLGFAGAFSEEEIPQIDGGVLLVAPVIAGEVDLELLKTLSGKWRIGLDAQGFVRFIQGEKVVFKDWKQKKEGLALVDVLKVDDKEADVLTGEKDLHKAASQLAAYGPKEIVLTYKDGVLVHSEGRFYDAPFRPVEIRGRSGRGDTCLCSYVAKRLSAEPQEAVRFAAAVTSLKLEATGPFHRSLADVERLAGAL